MQQLEEYLRAPSRRKNNPESNLEGLIEKLQANSCPIFSYIDHINTLQINMEQQMEQLAKFRCLLHLDSEKTANS